MKRPFGKWFYDQTEIDAAARLSEEVRKAHEARVLKMLMDACGFPKDFHTKPESQQNAGTVTFEDGTSAPLKRIPRKEQ